MTNWTDNGFVPGEERKCLMCPTLTRSWAHVRRTRHWCCSQACADRINAGRARPGGLGTINERPSGLKPVAWVAGVLALLLCGCATTPPPSNTPWTVTHFVSVQDGWLHVEHVHRDSWGLIRDITYSEPQRVGPAPGVTGPNVGSAIMDLGRGR